MSRLGAFLVFMAGAGILALDPCPVIARPTNSDAQIKFHIGRVEKNTCGVIPARYSQFRSFEPVLSTPAGPFYWTYLLVCFGSDSVGVGGIECGIDYQGSYEPGGGAFPISVFSWTLCADLEFPSTGWPAPGGGNLITWAQPNCHHFPDLDAPGYVIALAGHFYMGAYGPSHMDVTPRPVTGRLKVAACNGAEEDLTNSFWARGMAGFGPNQPYLGCAIPPLPIEPTTWSRVKTTFR